MIQASTFRHRALGTLIRLQADGSPALDLLPREAGTIALALLALSDGRSAESEIYLSPMASDHALHATASHGGIRLGDQFLDWDQVRQLATLLADSAKAS
ncbi:hypothetical protein A6A04_04260 [Paramagnetospirillum marisnigri]|uniref:Uncharacterized protein n=1 Tax=Paramagnetospirillum marisnigri TaxID=1285242 RepID=A0A178MH16_9PROT|nr:hypothetical protein [Paramagnetospirillum marisnigri]OAN47981.1 hypothetical protein A6A04_04260 [Paramagnetospirillum marisnigri]